MANFTEYADYDAIGLAGLVKQRDVSAGELLDAALARCEAVNPQINAVVRSLEAEARETIKSGSGDGPLAGVPFLLKDISAYMKGVPTSAGSRLFANTTMDRDSALVAALRRAGLVIFGKTNTPELGLACTTEPVLFGATHNPWNLALTPGGSSGGSAAAVAAGIVPAAHASDGGGSIRTPASCCGVFGMKPSRGRVSLAPFAGEGWGGLAQQHAVTRSVRDSALLLDIVSVPQLGDPYWAPPPERPFLEEVARDPGKLRIGFTTAALTWGKLEEPVVGAVKDAARLLETLGHHVEELPTLPGDFIAMAQAVNIGVQNSVASSLLREAERRGRPVTLDDVETLTMTIFEESKASTAVTYYNAIQTIHAIGRQISSVFETYDVVMSSTLAQLPVPLGYMDTNAQDLSGYGEKLYNFMPNTQPFNVSGSPAMSVPLAWSESGLPIGIQFAARNGGEATLFRLAGQLEKARPWAQRRPDEASLLIRA
ncbi:MAG TPA: amidase [Rhizomicrobium sp.]|jgi:Asp-tRNA(Asn)/Glu-tRNA(Gln) amidotransferase A subunit family amidase